eukprot:TRINITY_DN3775_c0_g1_i1.p2 TRINITY_DN3775_c0_g1~~TRINITY_DN3775_c0_g1_i1.p2  ORF type:complete len:156 (-),score=26.59 TRINITY_DN3775_c0_g1_i1:587-1054(-)
MQPKDPLLAECCIFHKQRNFDDSSSSDDDDVDNNDDKRQRRDNNDDGAGPSEPAPHGACKGHRHGNGNHDKGEGNDNKREGEAGTCNGCNHEGGPETGNGSAFSEGERGNEEVRGLNGGPNRGLNGESVSVGVPALRDGDKSVQDEHGDVSTAGL